MYRQHSPEWIRWIPVYVLSRRARDPTGNSLKKRLSNRDPSDPHQKGLPLLWYPVPAVASDTARSCSPPALCGHTARVAVVLTNSQGDRRVFCWLSTVGGRGRTLLSSDAVGRGSSVVRSDVRRGPTAGRRCPDRRRRDQGRARRAVPRRRMPASAVRPRSHGFRPRP